VIVVYVLADHANIDPDWKLVITGVPLSHYFEEKNSDEYLL
jgi:hypothetical protein